MGLAFVIWIALFTPLAWLADLADFNSGLEALALASLSYVTLLGATIFARNGGVDAALNSLRQRSH
jgi:hypothetical protein